MGEPLAEYIGIPYVDLGRDRKGLDCWGLNRLVAMDHMGVELPSYSDVPFDMKKFSQYGEVNFPRMEEVHKIIDHHLEYEWTRIEHEVVHPKRWDFMLAIIYQRFHCGVMLDRRMMIHSVLPMGVSLQDIRREPFNRGILGYYRHHKFL